MSTNSGGGDTLKMNTGSPTRNSKTGSRSWDKATYDNFDFNYGGIDWSKKSSNPVEIDPDEPICTICNGEAPSGTCVGCN